MDKPEKLVGFAFMVVVICGCLSMLTGCNDGQSIATVNPSTNYYGIQRSCGATNDVDRFRLVVIDGCEYLYQFAGGGASALTHKGNCTNSIHIYRAEDGK